MPAYRKRSPDGATPNWGSRHPIVACYSFIDSEEMKGWVGLVGWPIADGLRIRWSPVGYRSSAGQGKFAGQRPTFYRCATQPTWRPSWPGSNSLGRYDCTNCGTKCTTQFSIECVSYRSDNQHYWYQLKPREGDLIFFKSGCIVDLRE